MVGNKELRIVFLYENAFPVAEAAANRLMSIAKGLLEIGHDITVYCIRPSERAPNIVNTDTMGTYEGVKYIYSANTTIWPLGKVNRIKIYLKGILQTWKTLSKSEKNERPDIIISYCYGFFVNFIFWIFSKLFKIKFAFMVDEYPYSILYPRKHNFIFKFIELNFLFKFFDILFVMTTFLKEFYSKRVKKGAILEIIPMTVQFERFENYKGEVPSHQPYFAYAGFLGEKKDGVDILIKAFSKVEKIYNNIYLYIIGYSNNEEDQNALKELAFECGVKDKVIFTGKLHKNEIPKFLCNAIGLALARPDHIKAKGGFPTKLGEYLATGNPVIVTKVGDIPLYLNDYENAFLAEPGSVDSFSEKMLSLLNNPQKSIDIGLKGKEVALKSFNYKSQAASIDKILNSLNNK